MINKAPPFKGLNNRIPIIISMKRRGVINQGSGVSRGHGTIQKLGRNVMGVGGGRWRTRSLSG